MNRREVLLSLAATIFASAARAAGRSETNELLDASKGMFGWFEDLLANTTKIVVAERHRQLVVRLRNLNYDLARVSAQKYDLLEILRVQLPGPPHDFEPRADEVTAAIGRLREQVVNVTAELTEAYQAGGNECAELLKAAVKERKAWVNNIGSMDLKTTIRRGETAIHGLDQASQALGRLIAALDPPPLG